MAGQQKRYDAFISYSHSADSELAPAVQRGLQRFAKQWRARRALEVFRDGTGLAVNPDLWASITSALDGAEWFVLMSSPDAAASEWVGKEIEHWVRTRGASRLLPVVTDGTFFWDRERGDIDFTRSTAAHPALAGVWAAEPRHIDMTWARTDTQLTLRNPRFRDQIAEISAPMHGTTKDEIEGEDIRQQRRTLRLARGAVLALVLLTVAAVLSGALALRSQREAVAERDRTGIERDRAEAEARRSSSQATAARSIASVGNRIDRRMLLAAQAWAIEETAEARGALVSALIAGSHTVTYIPATRAGVSLTAVSPDGTRVAVMATGGELTVLEVETGEEIPSDLERVAAKDLMFLDEHTLAVATAQAVTVIDLTDGSHVEHSTGEGFATALDRRGFAVLGQSHPTRWGNYAFGALDQAELLDLRSGRIVRATIPAPHSSGIGSGYAESFTSADGRVQLIDIAHEAILPFGEPVPASISIIDPLEENPTLVAESTITTASTSLMGNDGAYLQIHAIDLDREAGRLAVASPGRLEVSDLRGGEGTTVELPSHRGRIVRLAFSADRLVFAMADGSTWVADPGTGSTTFAGGIAGWPRTLSAAPGGLVSVAGADDAVQVMDATGSQLGQALPTLTGECPGECVAISDDSRAVVITPDTEVVQGPVSGELETLPLVYTGMGRHTSVAISGDGSTVATAGDRGEAYVARSDAWDQGMRVPVDREVNLGGARYQPIVLAMALDGEGAILAAGPSVVEVATALTGDPADEGIRTVPVGHGVDHVAIRADGTAAVATAPRMSQRAQGAERVLAPSPRDPELFGGETSDHAMLHTIDVPDDLAERCSHPADDSSPPPSPEECGMAVGVVIAGQDPRGVTTAIPTGAGTHLRAVSFHGRDRLLVGSDGGVVLTLRLADLESGVVVVDELIARSQFGSEDIHSIDSILDGAVLIVGTESGLHVYDSALGTYLGTLATGSGDTYDIDITSDGNTFLLGRTGLPPVHISMRFEEMATRMCVAAGRALTDAEREALDLGPSAPRVCDGYPIPESSLVPTDPSAELPEEGAGEPSQDVEDSGRSGGPEDSAEPGESDEPEPGQSGRAQDTWESIDDYLAEFAKETEWTYVGDCEFVTVSVADALCSGSWEVSETEVVVAIGIPDSEVLVYNLMQLRDGSWTIVESFVPDESYEGASPDWLG